jgi:hypothetical protein
MKKPDALDLADALDQFHNPQDKKAAAELRRLHTLNQELVEALEAFDDAAKESQTIIGFAGRSLKLLTQARAALAKARRTE